MAVVVAGVLLCACASRGMIEGGPKDVTPPEITEEVPASGTTRFTGKRVDIHFNEFVQLKDINSKFVISPPQKKKPKTTLRGKYVRVEFQDSLKPGTTYTLDFQDAIVDNNGTCTVTVNVRKKREATMDMKAQKTFTPGTRNIFSINLVGNNLILQLRPTSQWEDDGDSEIVFE